MWPALIFAASRNERVIGRTKILRVSTSTKKGFSQSGAPPGSRPARNLVGEVLIEDRIKLNQIGMARAIVKNRCLVVLNTYGKRPVRLVERIKINSAVRRVENPFKCAPVVRFTWEDIISLGNIISWFSLLGWAQKVEVRVSKKRRFVLQNNGEGSVLNIVVVAGSKDEKISVSIKA